MRNGSQTKPILFVDVDGVISLFGFPQGYGLAAGEAPFEHAPPGRLHNVNGVVHYISSESGSRLRRLAARFDLVWATGWEETANEHLPALLELPGELPYLSFDGRVQAGPAHWKIEAIGEYAGARPFAWIDDRIDPTCHDWAGEHPAPTLLIETTSAFGMLEEHVTLLLHWAEGLSGHGGA
jgi:hypothetical protein